MRLLRLAFLFAAVLTVAPSAQTSPTGTWKAEFTGYIGDRPKTFGNVIFRLQAAGNSITGTAHMGTWPGDARITEAKLDGEKFSFTAIGSKGWSTQMAGQARVDHCCPKMLFAGIISGDEMTLTMVSSSTELSSDASPPIPMGQEGIG